MARNDKLGKILLGSALAGAAVGALTYFLKEKRARTAPGMTKIWRISMTI